MLPAFGLILFALITYDSVHKHSDRRYFHAGRYFYWSGIRLDSRPGKPPDKICGDDVKDCLEVDDLIVDSGLLEKILFFPTIPAFFIGSGIVLGLGRVGISEILTFFSVMPLLVGIWLYFLGWLVDRRLRSRAAAT